MKKLIVWISLVVTFFLVACGGGGSTATFTPEGALDSDFGTAGVAIGSQTVGGVIQSGWINDIVEDAQHRIVAVGRLGAKTAVWRFDTNGSLDNSFGLSGRVDLNSHQLQTVAMDGDKIVVVGNDTFTMGGVVFRLKTDGTPDATFGLNGRINLFPGGNLEELRGLIVREGHKLLITGHDGNLPSAIVIIKLLEDGSPDTTFGTAGVVRISDATLHSRGNGLTMVDSGGSEYIAVAGVKGTIPYMVRLTQAGSVVAPNIELPQAPSSHGRANAIVGFGEYSYSIGYEYNSSSFTDTLKVWSVKGMDGSLQSTFANNGTLTIGTLTENGAIHPLMTPDGIKGNDITISHAGELYAVGDTYSSGHSKGFVLRLEPDGEVDTSFSDNGVIIMDEVDKAYAVIVDNSGKVVVGGYKYNGSVLVPTVIRLR